MNHQAIPLQQNKQQEWIQYKKVIVNTIREKS